MIMSRKMNNMDAYFSSAKDDKVRSSSFSSTLLEAVYRSIDKEGQQPDEMSMFGAERNAKKKQTSGRDYSSSKREEIEKWMEKRNNVSSEFHDDGNHPRRKVLSNNNNNVLLSSEMARHHHGLASSSHCSYSSSTVERAHITAMISKIPKSKSTNSRYQLSNPTREATSSSSNKVLRQTGGASASTSSSRQFHKTKSHALKFYKELKKMKQPISPGGRLATLINSLFLTGHSKKAKFANDNNHEGAGADHQQPNENTCSSASSFARSCLSHKTSSSSASSTNKATRSVRFSSTLFNEQKPVKIDDGDSSDHAQTTGGGDIQALLRKYHNADLFAIYSEFEEAEDDEDGVSSCGSSDLFELDHLMGPIGMEELPVYETTLLSANRPIANSLLA